MILELLKTDFPPWLAVRQQEWLPLLQTGRCPPALLLQGQRGTGRRRLALWIAETYLGIDRPLVANTSDEAAGHPDLRIVVPPEDKAIIGVDQIRELVEFFRLTSHGGAGRLAIIWPAEAMNVNASNSLLKTLEEPPAGSCLILIAESVSRLPATIVSRCQRIRIPLPPHESAADWLRTRTGEKDIDELLDFAGGAPLAALELHESRFAITVRDFAMDLENLKRRRAIPGDVAARWNKTPDLALDWLAHSLAGEIRAAALACEPSANSGKPDVSKLRDSQACFRQLDQIRELRRFFKGGISTELNLAGLLMDWYGGIGR